jgi:hypothetical protein
MCLQLGFVIFWQKDFGAKAAHKMLVKLTPEKYELEGKKSFVRLFNFVGIFGSILQLLCQ